MQRGGMAGVWQWTYIYSIVATGCYIYMDVALGNKWHGERTFILRLCVLNEKIDGGYSMSIAIWCGLVMGKANPVCANSTTKLVLIWTCQYTVQTVAIGSSYKSDRLQYLHVTSTNIL